MPSKHGWLLIAASLALAAGCRGRPSAATVTAPPAASPTSAPAAETPPAGGATATPDPSPSGVSQVLRVWLPPEFTPDLATTSGLIFAEQIAAFEEAHPGVALELRTKAAGGVGGLMNALTNAANAAPGVLPDVVALRRDDLALAASAGLVAPLEAYVPPETLADFYPFAQSMGRAGGVWVGLPFAADARVLVYATRGYASPPLQWDELVTGTLAIPAAEPNAQTLLTAYLALGGTLADEGGRAHLEAGILSAALEQFQALQVGGVLPQSTLDYADASATWQVFRERRAALAVTTAQWYLAEYFRVEGAAMTLVPTAGAPGLALTDGWSWAIVNAAPERHALAAELLNWLLAPEQHAPWTEARAVLPTRAASLAGWETGRLAAEVSQVVTHAQLQPPGAVLGVAAPALREALADVLTGRATPFAAAGVAAEAVAGP